MYIKLPKSRIIPDPNQFYTECNRLGKKVIIVKRVCLYPNKSGLCEGCNLNTEEKVGQNVKNRK